MSLSKIELPPSESSSRPSSRALTESSTDESTTNLPVSINSSRPVSCLNPIPESGSEKSYKKIEVIELEVENNNNVVVNFFDIVVKNFVNSFVLILHKT